MRQEAYFCTVKELDELGKNNIPRQLISHTHLIYSSPATLAFNSPGAEGFGFCSGLSDQGRQMLLPVPTSPSVFKMKSAFQAAQEPSLPLPLFSWKYQKNCVSETIRTPSSVFSRFIIPAHHTTPLLP